MTRQPALYIPHGGGPCFFMPDPHNMWGEMAHYLKNIDANLAQKPKAILVISAHWEAPNFSILANPAPELLFDYYNFPPATYQLTWPAKNDLDLVGRVLDLGGQAGIDMVKDAQRGYDHGVFVPLLLSYPKADIPVLQLSLKQGLNPAEHMAMGAALAPLRDEGVLLIGSGMSSHNMRSLVQDLWLNTPSNPSHDFDQWLRDTVISDPETRNLRLANWDQAVGGRASHPREEHLLPLMVIAGAAGNDAATIPYHQQSLGATNVALSAIQFG